MLDLLTMQLVRIRGESMCPALKDGAWVLVYRRAYRRGKLPARLDIVRLEEPGRRGHWIVKRIVGLPGEEVRMAGGRLFVNGDELADQRLWRSGDDGSGQTHQWWPRTDEYVVIGDNLEGSTDSRKFGVAPLTAITGKVVRRLH
jgi:signal peptidase I